jgi:superfamily II RNA helicase
MRKRYEAGRKYSKRKDPDVRIKPGADGVLHKVFASIGVPPKKKFEPDPFQLKAIDAIKRADCLVTAPTGSGKTWIAEQAMAGILEKGGRAWYASPLKALSNSKYLDFSVIFGPENVGILTGDRKENPHAPVIVGTTEILRNQLYDAMHQGVTLSTDFVILDEAHFLGDEERGVVWEEVMIYLPARIPLLMLSATIGNAGQIAFWLSSIRKRECIVVAETKRPVPLFPLFLHPSGMILPLLSEMADGEKPRLSKKTAEYLKGRGSRPLFNSGRLPPFGEILNILKRYNLLPAIFFLKSRADCDASLDICTRHEIPDSRRLKLKTRIDELAETAPHILLHRQMDKIENNAVASHHSGQLPSWKLLVEKLMTEGLLDAVFATSTVAAGVNFPARTVVFLNSDRYNGKEFLPLSSTEFHQMTGRAGRRGMDNIGFAVAIPGRFLDLKLVAKLINSPPLDIPSQIRINFSMALNLLLSHSPSQIEDLLTKSFAAFLLKKSRAKKLRGKTGSVLWDDFKNHLDFLIEAGFVEEGGKLTEDGAWASQLRVDQPLIIAEGFRLGVFPQSDPVLLAAVIASFVNEKESDDRIDKRFMPRKLISAFLEVRKELRPFAKLMFDRGFDVRPLYLRASAAVYAWAAGEDWEKAVFVSEMDEGNLAMLILRTADNLRHIRSLAEVFPEASRAAGEAVDLIMRDPVLPFSY